jgi:hypothetical protein
VKEAIPKIWAELHFFDQLRLLSNTVAVEAMALNYGYSSSSLHHHPSSDSACLSTYVSNSLKVWLETHQLQL